MSLEARVDGLHLLNEVRYLFAPWVRLRTSAVCGVGVLPQISASAEWAVPAAASPVVRAAADIRVAATGLREAAEWGVSVPLHVTLLADADPRHALDVLAAGEPAHLNNDVVVVEHGDCHGVARVADLLRGIAELNYDRALALHPVTRLPGLLALTDVVERRLATRAPDAGAPDLAIAVLAPDLEPLITGGGHAAVIDGCERSPTPSPRPSRTGPRPSRPTASATCSSWSPTPRGARPPRPR